MPVYAPSRIDIVADPANVPPLNLRRYTPLFVVLQAFGGQLGLPLFIITMTFAPNVRRQHTLINFCATWIIYSVVYCLTIYNGRNNDEGSGGGLCVAQAAMVHGAVPMCATAYSFVILQIWYGLRTTETTITNCFERHRKVLVVLMLSSPYIVFIAFSIGSLPIALEHPHLVSRDEGSYYCTINYNPLVYAVPGYCAALIAIMLTMEVVIAVQLVRRWRVLKGLDLVNRSFLSMAIRVLVFSIYGFVTLAACAAFLARSLTLWPYLVQASLPTAVFLVFGTRTDVLKAWRFWASQTKQTFSGDSTTRCIEPDMTERVPEQTRRNENNDNINITERVLVLN